MYGRRVLYLIGLVVFTGTSALCGFAASTLMLQLSRGLQGVGAAIIFAVAGAAGQRLPRQRTAASRSGCGAR
jgi:MFS family permease